ncbi:rod shape-determining protein [Candidatus Saccharibacteria bacterium]|nr:rod shape-determining protein [Candidatus Saccharibacteria bacterium]
MVLTARAVLNEQQLENGVAVIDLGGATTSIAIFEEGDLQFVSVIPVGGMNITNDLAIGLKTDPEIAEKVKVAHASAVDRQSTDTVSVKHDKETLEFAVSDIDEVVDARLEEIFEAIHKELKRAGYAGKLPSGVVLTGGTSKMKRMVEYTKQTLGLAARLGAAKGYGGVAEHMDEPQFATAVGLMLIDSVSLPQQKNKRNTHGSAKAAGTAVKQAGGFLSGLLGRFKA